MAGYYKPRADSLLRRSADKGYRIGWKVKYGFERGHFDDEMTYGEAKKKAEEMMAKESNKVFWPEMIMDPHFEH